MDLKMVCSWCGKTMREGTPGAPVSHGICPECKEKLEAQLKKGGKRV